MKTIFVKPADFERKWYIVDAQGIRLGRLAAKIASILRGKHKPYYTPHQITGDYVVVINAEKVALTGTKEQNKLYYNYSGYKGGMKVHTFSSLRKRKPFAPLELAVKGMLPAGALGNQMFRNMKVYVGDQHPHAAQPVSYTHLDVYKRQVLGYTSFNA